MNQMSAKLFFVFCTSVFSTSVYAKWEHVYTNSLGDMLYVDDDTMTENTDDSNIVQAWVLTNSKKSVRAAGVSYRSMASQYEYDCQSSTSRFLQGAAYSQVNQKGRVLLQYTVAEDEASPVVPNTGGHKILQYACATD